MMNSGGLKSVRTDEVTAMFVRGTSSSTKGTSSQLRGWTMRMACSKVRFASSLTPIFRSSLPACMSKTSAHISNSEPSPNVMIARRVQSQVTGWLAKAARFASHR